jgi:hypothetical protein
MIAVVNEPASMNQGSIFEEEPPKIIIVGIGAATVCDHLKWHKPLYKPLNP